MLATLARRIGGWIGRLFGGPIAAAGTPAVTTGRQTVEGVRPVQQGPSDERGGEAADVRAAADVGAARGSDAPVQPEAVEGTSPPLREAARRSLVPRWLAALRTQTFTGLAAIGLLLFGGLTFLVTGGLTADADLVATQAVQGISQPWFGPLMLGVSLVGFPPQNLMLVAGIAALMWRAGYRSEAGFALAASASVILTEVVKRAIGRPRPDADLVAVVEGVTGQSFPSGHTLFYVTFFGFLGYLAYAHLKPGRLRTAVLWLSGLLILLVGPSRIWMGHHWASDVLASYALGLTYLILLVQWYGRRRLRTASAASAPAEPVAPSR